MKILQSDNGLEFVNTIIAQMVKLYGIDHRLITAYHPVANGMVERENKEVARALKKYTYSSSVRWHLWLPLIQLGLNTRFLARTKSTPFAVMFGREFNDFDDFKNIAFAIEITEPWKSAWNSGRSSRRQFCLP